MEHLIPTVTYELQLRNSCRLDANTNEPVFGTEWELCRRTEHRLRVAEVETIFVSPKVCSKRKMKPSSML